jgi:HAMP domain-containing protein
MIVFSNRRLGPAAELLVSPAVAESMLRATAAAACLEADARWELELVRWLEGRTSRPEAATPESSRGRPTATVIDVSEIAWTPDNFERQRRFLLRAIEQAAETSEHARALRLWAQMIEAHPRDSVQFGRLWTSPPSS